MKKILQRFWWLLLAVFLAVSGGVLALLLSGPSGVTLRLTQQLGNPRVVDVPKAELREFQTLRPGVRVELADEGADVAALANFPADPAAWTFPLTPWSGNLWVLASRRDKLDELAKSAPEAVAALRSGTLDPDGFAALLAKAKGLGTPLTVGNSHLWPFMVWVQAWTAATRGPSAAAPFPPAAADIAAAVADLRKWRAQGWFDARDWSQGWAQGLAPLQDGTAFFALINEAMLTAIQPERRASLEFLRFPRRTADGPWNVGSAHFLAVSAKTAHGEQAGELVRYLTSPGVTARLAQATGRPFFSWVSDGAEPKVLPDWTSRANDQAFRNLAQELAK